ncbi:hypothetical protein OG625_37125 [Streptomyces sp. NBC_01351]|uniref:hypothetical protein n=1 Tax=Streptomyces sp. NBC_01351 TaxID=2903833 RepID=UPI002E345754|nr:hypothetical protein [Streptomyces sp. NBC_01351]
MPDLTQIVVHPVAPSGGRRVVAHVHGEDRPLGKAYRMEDVVEFLQRAGWLDEELWPPIEWRGGGANVWSVGPAGDRDAGS